MRRRTIRFLPARPGSRGRNRKSAGSVAGHSLGQVFWLRTQERRNKSLVPLAIRLPAADAAVAWEHIGSHWIASVHYSGASAAEFHRLPSPQPTTVAAGLWPPEGTRKGSRFGSERNGNENYREARRGGPTTEAPSKLGRLTGQTNAAHAIKFRWRDSALKNNRERSIPLFG